MPINKINIVPTWSFRDESGRELDPQLFSLLRYIETDGKLTSAAQSVGISYRHAWNQLNKWADFFGTPLVELQKGRGARLTPLGAKLVWAEKRVIARLEPQLDNITSDLNLELSRLLEGTRPCLRLQASHGYAVELLPRFVQSFELDLQYRNAREALASLGREQCDLAGFHLPVSVLSEEMKSLPIRLLKPRAHRIIRFITRQQGLMVAAGNPLAIQGLDDLHREDLVFINRENDSGTRLLLDELLRRGGHGSSSSLSAAGIEYTHSAIAAHVAAGMADMGFGVQAAAGQFGLDFIPLAQEQYLLACHQRTLEHPACQILLALLRSEPFRAAVAELPGYDAHNSGEVLTPDVLFAQMQS
ncbi:molybdate transport repressor ModE-like protein [Marinobacterium halophilum]|uniref:Molybdate transport repressor ModE-like protein n=1 Tax=Marinobacterium halophilum TaxID=267374 RepID=A0A2P8ERG6_9GAMM|nr:molybdate transport repressor ModE-like protein [Marinobacterium halophilum]